MKMGDSRRTPAGGSLKQGWADQVYSNPRVAIMFPVEMMAMLRAEAFAEHLPFAEIVRRRITKSYGVSREDAIMEASK